MSDAPLLGRMLWYELLTTDMKAAEAFYTHVVGWTITPFEGAPMPYDMWTRDGGVPIGGAMTLPAGMNFPPHWAMYVGVPKLEDAVARIEKLGGSALSPVIDVPTVGRMRTMRDPQGAVFSVYEPASAPEQPEALPELGDVSWHELYTTDAAAAKAFYEDLFGWRETETMDMGPMGKYYMFGRGLGSLGGMMTKTPDMAGMPEAWMVYFRVPDVDAAVERIQSKGGKVLNGPMEVPGGDRILQALDPQGAAFALHSKKG
jgi:predicted enzyme related to lactoylglutathione lyase